MLRVLVAQVVSLLRVELPIYGRHWIGVDADAVGQAERCVRGAPADRGLAAGHLRALLAALRFLALHLVASHFALTLSRHLISL